MKSNKCFYGVSLLMILFIYLSCAPHEEAMMFVKGNLPSRHELPEIDSSDIVISHLAYTLSFNPNTLIANWVAYELKEEETDGLWSRGGLRFMPDPAYHGLQATHDDYRHSGYSRGHLAPAGDMKWDSLAMIESFYFTNCFPQDKELNNGRWNQLEMKTRALARDYGSVYVVCGPVFYEQDTLFIGDNGVAVPHACFKALLIPVDSSSYSAIGFLMGNAREDRRLPECACSVDELEALIGKDLFYDLPDEVEAKAESKIDWQYWGF